MMVWISLALAGGAGAYFEGELGTATSDSTGVVARGTSTTWTGGIYWGAYRGSFRYGPYWRLGLAMRGQYTEAFDSELERLFSPSLELGRGVDILKLGFVGGLQLGPVVVRRPFDFALGPDPSPGPNPDPTPITYGVGLRGFGGVAYNINHSVAASFRMTWGLQVDGDGFSTTRGFAIAATARVPVYKRRWRTPEEEED